MKHFKAISDFEAWLDRHGSYETNVTLSVRLALRLAPALTTLMEQETQSLRHETPLLAHWYFRSAAGFFISVLYPDKPGVLRENAERVAGQLSELLVKGAFDNAALFSRSANLAAFCARFAADPLKAANYALASMEVYDPPRANSIVLDSLSADAALLERGVKPHELIRHPLWQNKPYWADPEWLRLAGGLHAIDPSWRVWIDWYNAVLDGRTTGPRGLSVARSTVLANKEDDIVAINEELWTLNNQNWGLSEPQFVEKPTSFKEFLHRLRERFGDKLIKKWSKSSGISEDTLLSLNDTEIHRVRHKTLSHIVEAATSTGFTKDKMPNCIQFVTRTTRDKIFISYAREDLKVVLNYYNIFINSGFTPWMDEFELLPGHE